MVVVYILHTCASVRARIYVYESIVCVWRVMYLLSFIIYASTFCVYICKGMDFFFFVFTTIYYKVHTTAAHAPLFQFGLYFRKDVIIVVTTGWYVLLHFVRARDLYWIYMCRLALSHGCHCWKDLTCKT